MRSNIMQILRKENNMKKIKIAALIALTATQVGTSLGADFRETIAQLEAKREARLEAQKNIPSNVPQYNWSETFILMHKEEKVGEISHYPTLINSRIKGQCIISPTINISGSIFDGHKLPQDFAFSANSTRDQFVAILKRYIELHEDNSILLGNGDKVQ